MQEYTWAIDMERGLLCSRPPQRGRRGIFSDDTKLEDESNLKHLHVGETYSTWMYCTSIQDVKQIEYTFI